MGVSAIYHFSFNRIYRYTDLGSAMFYIQPLGDTQRRSKQADTLLCLLRKQPHLLHFGHHVLIDDIHVRVCHPHQHLNHHLSLLSREACSRKTLFVRKNHIFLLTKKAE